MAQSNKPPVLQKPPGYRDPRLPIHNAPKPLGPPRKPVLPPSFRAARPKRRRSCRRTCCCFLLVAFLLLLLLAAAAGALFYLFFQPKPPVFRLRSVQIPRFNVTAEADGGGTYLEAQAVAIVEAENPNRKIELYYGRSEMQVRETEEGAELGSGSVGGFEQGRMNSTVLRFAARQGRTLVDDGAGARLKARFRSKTLGIAVEVRTRFGLGVERWRTGTVGMRVVCGDTSLKKLSGETAESKCKINLLKWITIH